MEDMNNRRGGNFLKGTLIGVAIGAIAGILFAPKSGEETREDLKKAAKDIADKTEDIYADASKMLTEKLDALRKVGKRIDRTKYTALIQEVLAELKDDREVTADASRKIGAQLRRDWDKVSKALSSK